MIEFSVIDEADQKFATTLSGRRVTIRLRYNRTPDRWMMDLSVDDLPVLHGRRIVSGVDLLAAFDFGIGVIFAYPTNPGDVPDRAGLPAGSVKIFHTTQEEIDAVIGA